MKVSRWKALMVSGAIASALSVVPASPANACPYDDAPLCAEIQEAQRKASQAHGAVQDAIGKASDALCAVSPAICNPEW